MRIRTKLRLTVAASVAAVAIIIPVIIFVGGRNVHDSERIGQYHELSLKTFALNALTDSYLFDPRERTREQWESVHRSLEAIMREIEPDYDYEKPLLASLEKKHRELTLHFSRLVQLQGDGEDSAISSNLKERLSNQISVDLQAMLGDASRLMREVQKKILASDKRINHLTILLVLVLALVSGGILLLTSNRIVKSVVQLHEATDWIAGKEWDHKVAVTGDDEIGQLAQAFNDMAGRLSSSYTALETEVAERERAERELKLHKDHLERLVRERTAELVAANTQMKEEIEFRRQAQDALRQSEERLQLAVAATGDAIYDIDLAEGKVIWNETYTRRYGRPLETANSWQWWIDHIHPDERQSLVAFFKSSLDGEADMLTCEYRFQRPDGTWADIYDRAHIARDRSGKARRMVGAMMDLTARKQAQEALSRARDELELRVQERTAELVRVNQSLDEFASIASHDMQEPLRKILAFGDQLKKRCGDALDDTGRDYLDRMQKAARRMQTLLAALLDYSRVSSKVEPFTRVDLSRVVREVLDDLEVRIHQTGAAVEAGELPSIQADPHQMRQLFQNLIGNGLKYHGKERPVVRVHAEPSDNSAEWRIFVQDNGIGFDEKHVDRIFAPFQRLHGRSEFEGTGMGLAICKRIVERHGGTITARSTPGEGAIFVVSLPAGHG